LEKLFKDMSMHVRKIRVLSCAVCSVLFLLNILPFPAVAAPQKYHLINLSDRISGDCHVLDMNNHSQIVGYVVNGSVRTAFVWRRGAMVFLQPLSYGCECIAEGINDSGIAVGYAYTQPVLGWDDQRIFHAVMWDTNGTIRDLGTMGGYLSVAFEINNKGQVAGFYGVKDSADYMEHVYLWENGAWKELPVDSATAGYEPTSAFDGVVEVRNGVPENFSAISPKWRSVNEITLNNNGDVASSLQSNAFKSYSILWKHQGEQIDLNALLTNCGYEANKFLFLPGDMTDSLHICGVVMRWNVYVTFTYDPVVWLPSVVCGEKLQSMQSNIINASYINNKNVTAGSSFYGYSDTSSNAVIWQGASIFLLDNYVIADTITNFKLKSVAAINDSGAITGQGFINEKQAAYLLIPQSPQITMPQLGKFTITLIQASAQLVSDVYLYRPDSVLMIQNNLKNVGKTYDTIYPAGTELEFAICVHPLPGKGQPYWFTSDSKHARVTKANDTLWYISFEDLPDSIADWDFNDVALKVALHMLGPSSSTIPNFGHGLGRFLHHTGPVEVYDARGRMLGTFQIDSRGRLTDKSGCPMYGVHLIRPAGCNGPEVTSKLLNMR
jgi:hypothetical protein